MAMRELIKYKSTKYHVSRSDDSNFYPDLTVDKEIDRRRPAFSARSAPIIFAMPSRNLLLLQRVQ